MKIFEHLKNNYICQPKLGCMITDSIKKGDINAYKEFFMDYYPILCCFANNILKNSAVSKDIAQEALLKYWERKENFDNIYQVKSFLYIVSKNMCLNFFKKEAKSVDFDNVSAYLAEFESDKSIIEQETLLLVRKSIGELPTRMRSIIELSMKGMKNSQIADSLSITEETVHSLKQRAYKKLKNVLGDNYYLIIF